MISIAAIANVRLAPRDCFVRASLDFHQNGDVDNTTINFVSGTEFQHDTL
jgi:hypothetical protein